MRIQQGSLAQIWKYTFKWLLIFSMVGLSLLVALALSNVIGAAWVHHRSAQFCNGISIGEKIDDVMDRGKQAKMHILVSTLEKTRGGSTLDDPMEVPFSGGTLSISYSVRLAVYMCICTMSFSEKKITEKHMYCLM